VSKLSAKVFFKSELLL